MKNRLLSTLFILMTAFSFVNAQMECNENLVVDLNGDGVAQVPVTDLVANIEFMLTQGTVSYYLFPGNTGIIESADDLIEFNCNNIYISYYIIEVTSGQSLIENCSNEVVVNHNGACGSTPDPSCEDGDCLAAKNVYVATEGTPVTVDAIDFSLCGAELNCMTYSVAYGLVEDAGSLTFAEFLSTDGLTDFENPVVLFFSDASTTVFQQVYLYYWDLNNCSFIGYNVVSQELGASAELTITPDMFMFDNGNACDNLSLGITTENGPAPTDYTSSLIVDCDNVGLNDIYIRNDDNGELLISSLFLKDPLEVCGTFLGEGDKLISLSEMPGGTIQKTDVLLNGTILPRHPGGIGWVMNEDDLADGSNTLNFVSDGFELNGVSTLDLVLGMRIILMDDYDEPIESVVFDVDQSGYNGIGDLVQMRALILGQDSGENVPNAFFVHNNYTFPPNFNPFDFENNFTEYTFEDSLYNDIVFEFAAYKVGDLNDTAVPGLHDEDSEISTTRSVSSIGVSDMTVKSGEEFTFELKYESETKFKGFLTALVGNGIEFLDIETEVADTQSNIIDDNELRVSYLNQNLEATISSISFTITAKASEDGELIDMLGLKSEFPQEVVDENDETITIDELETIVILSVGNGNGIEIELYPNPVSDFLTLKTNHSLEIKQVDVFSMTNERMYSNKSIDQKIDVSQWPTGLYFLEIQTNKGNETVRFLKK